MPSFDIQSKVDGQTLDNAVNVVKKEILNRWDFKGTHVSIELDKKEMKIEVEVETDMKLEQAIDVLLTKSMRQGLEATCFDLSKDFSASGKYIRKTIPVKNGLSKEDAKRIVKLIKEKPGLNPNAYMGLVMKNFSGKISGKEVMEIINKILK